MAGYWTVDSMTKFLIHGVFRERLDRLRMSTWVFKGIKAADLPLAESKLGWERWKGLRCALKGNRGYLADLMVPQVCQADLSGLRTVSGTESICLGRPRNIPCLNVRSYSTSRRTVDVGPPTQAKVKAHHSLPNKGAWECLALFPSASSRYSNR